MTSEKASFRRREASFCTLPNPYFIGHYQILFFGQHQPPPRRQPSRFRQTMVDGVINAPIVDWMGQVVAD